MNLKQSNTLQSLKEIQTFLDERAAELPGLNATGMRKKFDDAVAELTKLAATQTSSDLAAMSTTRKIYVLTQDLIEHHMQHVARIAALTLPPGPELAPLAMPRAKADVIGERLAARARGMATEAQKYESTFVDAGLPKDFIQQLRDKAEALSVLVAQRKQETANRGAATDLLRTQIREARKVVKVLDGFVGTAAKGNEKVLLTWKILKRMRQPEAAPAAPAATPVQPQTPPSTSTGAAA